MKPSKDTYLLYNGERRIKIDRQRVADSCWYFQRLLEGTYRESKQQEITMHFGTAFSFEAFKIIIDYASERVFLRDIDNIERYFQAIQLAIALHYEELYQIIEDFLIHFALSEKDIDALTTLARNNLPMLQKLNYACDEFAESMKFLERRPMLKCYQKSHGYHLYLTCGKYGPYEDLQKECESPPPDIPSMSVEEKFRFAKRREVNNFRARFKPTDRGCTFVR